MQATSGGGIAGKDKADKNKRDEQKPVFLCIGVYDDPLIAGSDLEIVRELYDGGVIATYDAAITTKELDGTVTVGKVEKPTQHGAWTGAAVGAVVGILFPPFSPCLGRDWRPGSVASSAISGGACRTRISTTSASFSTTVRPR